MSKLINKTVFGFRFVYLIMFFALLSGFFHPLVQGSSFNNVVIGVLVLFIGLAGTILAYQATKSEKRKIPFLGGGFGLILISLFLIFQLTGRV